MHSLVGSRTYQIIAVILTIVLVGIGMPFTIEFLDQNFPLSLIGATILFVICIIGTLLWWRAKSRDFFHPFVMISLSFILGYLLPLTVIQRPSNIMLIQAGYQRLLEDSSLIAQTLIVSTIGFVAFVIGFQSRFNRNNKKERPATTWIFSQEKFTLLIILYIIIGTVIWLGLILSSGGISGFTRGFAGRLRGLDSRYYLITGAMLLASASVMWYAIRLAYKQNQHTILFVLVLGWTLVSLVFNGGSRTPLMMTLLALLIVRHYLKRSFSSLGLISIFLILAIIYTTFQAFLREYIILGTVSLDPYGTGNSTYLSSFFDRLTAGSAIMLQTLMITIHHVPEYLGFQNGETFLALILAPIPRAIFAAKPISPAGIFSQTFFPGPWARGTSIPPSMVGELYLNGGIWAVGLGMFLMGLFFRFAYDELVLNRKSPLHIAAYAITLASMYPWLRGESLGPTVTYLVLVIPILFGLFWSYERKRERSETGLQQRQDYLERSTKIDASP